jgi:hypothetical protein
LWFAWLTAGIWLLAATLVFFDFQFFGWLNSDQSFSARTWRWLGGALLLVVGAAGLVRWRIKGWGAVVGMIEASFPTLRQRLFTSVELLGDTNRSQSKEPRIGYLEQQLLLETVTHGHRYDWKNAVCGKRLAVARCASLVALGIFCYSLFHASSLNETRTSRARRAFSYTDVAIEPGDVELEKGSSLVVIATFPKSIPQEAFVEISRGSLDRLEESGDDLRRQPMVRNLDDPTFGAFVPNVQTELRYLVSYDNTQSKEYRVTVFEFPDLRRANAHLEFPSYTGLATRTVQDTRRVTVVEGTRIEWECELNKEVQSAELVDEHGQRIALEADERQTQIVKATLVPERSTKWKLELVDKQGRRQKRPIQLQVTLTPNQLPQIKLELARDARVSPLEELVVKGKFQDDYGLAKYGISYHLADQEVQDLVLGTDSARKEERKSEHLLDFEALRAEPDQLLSYYLWAEDSGPDGKPRRTMSDMFFAEVRHFEEIFREGQAPPGGESPQQPQQPSQNEQQAEELAELQKQVIAGIWKVMRRETGALTKSFLPDVELLSESQVSAMDQLESLAERVRDQQSQQHLSAARRAMLDAHQALDEAAKSPSKEPLPNALSAAQLAYQGLLKLRAREHEVVRSRQQRNRGQQSAAQRQRQQQLDELELKQEENRYETQRLAEEQADSQEQREMRQVLNRLRELAQRQEDLNEQIQQMQTALEAAKTDEEKEELQRQLKRLREQQEEILRDSDELLERMQQPSSSESLAEARQQMEQARENSRQASESLEQNNLSQALTSGTRAERDLADLRDQVREQMGNQFSDTVRQMRREARELEERQQEIASAMDDVDEVKPGTGLRREDQRGSVADDLKQQKDKLSGLLEQIRETVEQAEEAEPLLAKELYEGFREAEKEQLTEKLDLSAELIQRGLTPQSQEAEEMARDGIARLRAQVDRASESVLGSEMQSLERAMNDLKDLERALQDEMGQSDPHETPRSDQADSRQPSGPTPSARERERPVSEGNSPGRRDEPRRSGGAPEGREGERQNGGERDQGGGLEQFAQDGRIREAANPRLANPITGEGFRDWIDRLRDVEELVNDPDLRSQAARIRDRTRDLRRETTRHSQAPQWDLVESMIAKPLRDLRRQVSDELLRRSAEKNAVVPIDRDPVPSQFSRQVQRYYENLGSGE